LQLLHLSPLKFSALDMKINLLKIGVLLLAPAGTVSAARRRSRSTKDPDSLEELYMCQYLLLEVGPFSSPAERRRLIAELNRSISSSRIPLSMEVFDQLDGHCRKYKSILMFHGRERPAFDILFKKSPFLKYLSAPGYTRAIWKQYINQRYLVVEEGAVGCRASLKDPAKYARKKCAEFIVDATASRASDQKGWRSWCSGAFLRLLDCSRVSEGGDKGLHAEAMRLVRRVNFECARTRKRSAFWSLASFMKSGRCHGCLVEYAFNTMCAVKLSAKLLQTSHGLL
jgi:hypothetical protein